MYGPFLPCFEQWTLYALFAVIDTHSYHDHGVAVTVEQHEMLCLDKKQNE